MLKEFYPIQDYEDRYLINEYGKIWSLRSNIFMKPFFDKRNYLKVALRNQTGCKHYFIHRLVTIQFIKNIGNKPQVNHKDTNKLNNHISNLEWCTNQENMTHAHSMNLYNNIPKGENHINSKLTNNDVIKIKKLLDQKKLNQKQIAKKFNVDPSRISSIKMGVSWKHVVS